VIHGPGRATARSKLINYYEYTVQRYHTEFQALLLRPLATFLKAETSGTPPLSPSLPPSVSVFETDLAVEDGVSRRRRRQTSPPLPHPADIGHVRERLFSGHFVACRFKLL
jgi:hypothetical protein